MLTVRRVVSLVCALVCGSLSACHSEKPAGSADNAPSSAAAPAPSGVRRTLIDRQPATDLPGWETRLYLVEYPPGTAAPLHVHPAVGVGFVLDGRFESAFGDEPAVEVQAGHGFVERAGAPHRVFRNPSADHVLRFVVAFTLRSGDEPFYLGARHVASSPP